MNSHEIHTTRLQLRYSDFDDQGVLNNAVYLTLFELARIEFFREALGNMVEDYRFMIAHVEIDYLRPIRMRWDAVCATEIVEIGNSSIKFYQEMSTDDDAEAACVSRTVAVLFDRNGNRKTFTNDLKHLLRGKE